MSKRDFDLYYEEMFQQRQELLENIRDFEELCKREIITPERLEELNANVKPLIDNYERLAYVKFLLDIPVKKDKKEKYYKISKKQLEKLGKSNSLESCIDENERVIEKVRDMSNSKNEEG